MAVTRQVLFSGRIEHMIVRRRRCGAAAGALVVGAASLVLQVGTSAPPARAQAPNDAATALRTTSPAELGVDALGGVTFDPADRRLVVSSPRGDQVASTDAAGDSFAEAPLPGRPAPATMTADPGAGRLTAVAEDGVVSVTRGGDARATARPLRSDVDDVVAAESDPATGRWFSLVDGGTAMAVFADAPDVAPEPPHVLSLRGVGPGEFRAIAPNPVDGFVYLLADRLYAIDGTGTLRRTVDLRGAELRSPSDMVFAPSADTTDAADVQSLYLVDRDDAPGSTRLVEATLAPVAMAAGAESTLVATSNLSTLSPPSPDSSGVAYMPSQDRLVVSDGEVDEMTIFQGANLFQLTRSGVLADTGVTTAVSDEPTGVAFDPAANALFTSDDDDDEVYRFVPGADGRHGTGDDSIGSFDTRVFGGRDAEDLAYDPTRGDLYLIDGVNREVYRVRPNANGFDGVPARGGDDTVTQFDVGQYGAVDPEGIAYDAANDHLLVVDDKTLAVYELTIGGELVQKIGAGAATQARKLAGITLAPASNGSGTRNLFIVDRGVDNDSNPDENDGRMYEMTFPGGGGPLPNRAPSVNAGVDLSTALPAGVSLDGTVVDDGLPAPPGAVTTAWSEVSGPGDVAFANAAAVDTTATFSAAGTYVLRLSADDSALSASDDVLVTVAPAGSTLSLDVGLAAASDDAEEDTANGAVDLTSSDIELVAEGARVQVVGLRFAGVALPDGAVVQNAWVQFTTDETDGSASSLVISGQAADDATTFSTAIADVSARARTTASAAWSPPAWATVGQAGAGQRTPNLAAVVQQIVDRPGWVSGNPLAFVITGSGRRTAEAFNAGPGAAPRLHIEYTVP
ncbi:MAG TPA: hypothetical protein VFY82_11120 [Acidimicrobiales bacterium]|nr:hypothetical protein [Acidimicrobiales bacterium]